MKRLRKPSVPIAATLTTVLSLLAPPTASAADPASTQTANLSTISAPFSAATMSAETSQANSASSSPGSLTPNVVGGQPATEPYPLEGTLLLDRGDGQGLKFHCGLTLVATIDGTSWFGTNAHCITPEGKTTLYSPSMLRVTLGSNFRSQQTTYPVWRVTDVPFWSWTTPHPGPNGEQGDIALVAVPVLVPARPLLIAPSQIGDPVRVIGWGLTSSPPGGSLPDQLQQLDLHQIPAKHCAHADPGIATGEFCTDNPNGAGMCFGDSDSGALRQTGDHWFLVGSASRKVKDDQGTCGGDDPGILTSWWYYLEWFAQTILGPDWANRVAAQPLTATAHQILPPGAGDTDRLRMQIAYALAG
jgi:hypothetical protein